MQSTDALAESEIQLTPEMKEELRLARRFFSQIDRMSTLLTGYPAGHPVVEQAVAKTYDSLYEYFELNDRLTVQVDPHELVLSGTDEAVWETDEPKDYCFALSRDGVFLIHLLAGLERTELRRFVEILNILVDPTDMSTDAVTLLFESNFSYIAFEAIDESLAALAGIDADIRDRDTAEEREMIEEMFNDAFENIEEEQARAASGTMGEQFQIKMQVRAQRQQKLEVGSRQFLQLDERAQQHLLDLKRGFTEHRELEHREGEMLSALLGAKPKPGLRRECVDQIGEVMGALVETDEPWEALNFLKIIHAWRDRFAPEVTGELKAIVKDCFTQQRMSALVKQVATGDKRQRRAILQMFDALHLEKASMNLVTVLGWELAEDARGDIMAYIRKQAGFSLEFLRDAVDEVPADQVEAVLEILIDKMPESRSILVELLGKDHEPPVKTRLLEALRGTWEDPREIRDILVPYLEASNTELQMEAIRNFTEAAPQHVPRVMGPMIDNRLKKRPEEEVKEIVTLFVKHGRGNAVDHLESLIRKRGMVGMGEQELAVIIIRALVNSRQPQVVKLLESISKDWLVPKRIRNNCKEVAELLSM
ncbi:hypothetical protein FIV42_26565 [Persicimonas caeni]|uniref:HEAT repeat domain-containing protein n=1 Tax=Persicimonas caeni TaxID=2292766 RepID=A0A4Y6Q0S0_PERCE|nr:hypothetical protein [Persicimonas caeni]QDG54176.1 hypothetical protein FIV42_26565 [Persicimonas caeni]QED35397.1 hypothetical protein FRD00_26560 [Persicimonas caeni]